MSEDTHESLYKLGMKKTRERDWAGAIEQFSRAIELKPDYAEAYTQRGAAKYASGDPAAALVDYEKALQLQPNHPSVREVIKIVRKKLNPRAKPTGSQKIPVTEKTVAVRTDFMHAYAWKALRDAIENPNQEFRANVQFLNEPKFKGFTPDQLLPMLTDEARTIALIVDEVALTSTDFPILVIDLMDSPGRTFRVVAAALWEVENNLSIANMDFDDFANDVEGEGIYRGSGL